MSFIYILNLIDPNILEVIGLSVHISNSEHINELINMLKAFLCLLKIKLY